MKHYFAELNDQNEVTRVIIFSHKACCYADGEHDETLGIQRCHEQCGPDGTWVETYRDHPKGEGRRGNHAGIGMTYMTEVQTLGVASTDIFIHENCNEHNFGIIITNNDDDPPKSTAS